MNETPLHLRLADRSPEQIRDEFPHMLEIDLLEQGFTEEDAALARDAAAQVMELCGVRDPAPMRRRAATDATRSRQSRGIRLAQERAEAQPCNDTLTTSEASTDEQDATGERLAA